MIKKGGCFTDNGASSYRRFLEGDNDGLTEIVRDYKDGLIFYLTGIVGDIYIAEDLTEDTFLKLMIKKPRDKGGASFKTWLYAIGRNTAIDYLRKSGKNVCGDLTYEISDDEKSLENACIDGEREIIIHRAMRNLKKEYREVLWLTYFENFGNKQTASVMKKSVHAVETLLYRARNALKTELEREGYTYENL